MPPKVPTEEEKQAAKDAQTLARRQAELDRLATSLVSFIGWLTRHINEGERFIEVLQRKDVSSILLEKLQQQIPKIDDCFTKIQTTIDEMIKINTDPDQKVVYEARLKDEEKRRGDMIQRLLTAASHCQGMLEGGTPRRGAAAAAAEPKGKTDTGLKPKTLTLSFTPIELAVWLRAFNDFYVTSGLENSTLAKQQAYFRSCLDPTLENSLNPKILPGTPIQPTLDPGQNSCIGLLKEAFVTEYPIFTRRLDYFQVKQKPNQKYSEFYKLLKKHQAESDVAALDVDALMTMLMMTGCNDQEIRKRFLQEDEKTEANFVKIVTNYEAGLKYISAMKAESVSANAVRGNSARGGRGRGAPSVRGNRFVGTNNQSYNSAPMGHTDSPIQHYMNQLRQKGKCIRCGASTNEPDNHPNCKAFDAVCNSCGKTGHQSNVCARTKTGNQQPRGQQPQRGQRGRGRGGRGATRGTAAAAAPAAAATANVAVSNMVTAKQE